MKKRTHNLLRKAHRIINEATGTDIPKSVLEQAKIDARKIYRIIKDSDPKIYDIIRGDDDKLK